MIVFVVSMFFQIVFRQFLIPLHIFTFSTQTSMSRIVTCPGFYVAARKKQDGIGPIDSRAIGLLIAILVASKVVVPSKAECMLCVIRNH